MNDSSPATPSLHPETPLLGALEHGEVALRDFVRRSNERETLWEIALEVVAGDRENLPGISREATQAWVAEPHFLGWLHQHLGEARRLSSFENHVHRAGKHAASTTTTQLYTPRWVADALVRELFEITGVATLLDPACGGGQMLLAWVDHLILRGVEPLEAFSRVRGVDLDPGAVEATEATLRHHAARFGLADITLDLRCADGLFDTIEPAEIVLTNPPYMGRRSMDDTLKTRLTEDFRGYEHDLYTAFSLRAHQLATRAIGVLAQQTIWYLSRYESARRDLLNRGHITWFCHLGPRVFRSLSGEKANVVAFVQTTEPSDAATRVIDVRDLDVAAKRDAVEANQTHEVDLSRFGTIPGLPIAHWLRAPLLQRFGSDTLGDLATIPGGQNKTGANRRFVRPWGDVEPREIRNASDLWQGTADGRWAFYSKGGAYAPWWGNWNAVVDWSDEAQAFYRTNKTSNLLNEAYRWRTGLTYSDFGGKRFAARWLPEGALFDMAGPALFMPDDDHELLYGALVLLNSEPARELLNALNPSIHYQVRDLRNLPLPAGFSEGLLREWAPVGERLVAATRALHRGVLGDPLFDDATIAAEDLARLRDDENLANQLVCDVYGIEAQDVPIHHAFERLM